MSYKRPKYLVWNIWLSFSTRQSFNDRRGPLMCFLNFWSWAVKCHFCIFYLAKSRAIESGQPLDFETMFLPHFEDYPSVWRTRRISLLPLAPHLLVSQSWPIERVSEKNLCSWKKQRVMAHEGSFCQNHFYFGFWLNYKLKNPDLGCF